MEDDLKRRQHSQATIRGTAVRSPVRVRLPSMRVPRFGERISYHFRASNIHLILGNNVDIENGPTLQWATRRNRTQTQPMQLTTTLAPLDGTVTSGAKATSDLELVCTMFKKMGTFLSKTSTLELHGREAKGKASKVQVLGRRAIDLSEIANAGVEEQVEMSCMQGAVKVTFTLTGFPGPTLGHNSSSWEEGGSDTSCEESSELPHAMPSDIRASAALALLEQPVVPAASTLPTSPPFLGSASSPIETAAASVNADDAPPAPIMPAPDVNGTPPGAQRRQDASDSRSILLPMQRCAQVAIRSSDSLPVEYEV